ncbi:MAG: tRNA uridine-5-carboxymethylaminomethyl(34) synthesis enzyme MnmG [Malacoplasma sp.]|nr:tRNA uridine-5-carboxymethylaminomethyl(34) synthesis enzyme MnmG [Malacoplasma sp.]MDE5841939.1 tRNA uridine-5-carboxymethylaminomethyl(34) synthesis enzyme MnmG [Malacoplasma sp.]
MTKKYDCLIIGAGHAGLEAAFILAKKKYKVALFALDENLVGNMPCNPSIGGPAKGIVTREIDALGGMQGIAADANQLQMKLLNSSKGPGTWALRAQVDKIEYSKWFLKKIKENTFIDLIPLEVIKIKIINNKVQGVYTIDDNFFESNNLIITTGTFLDSSIHIGSKVIKKGPDNFNGSYLLAKQIKKLDFKTIRLKTGTPPRILKNSIDYSKLLIEPGTNKKLSFSHFDKTFLDFKNQEVCYLAYTNEKVHEIINRNLNKSAMYSGFITGTGPRYCPSIEDKIVRFNDKNRHQLFVEPESKQLDTIYLGGFSSSLPEDVQIEAVKNIVGFEKAIIKKYAYAIEYDAISSIQLYATLETKKINGLFFAGQVNGTSGYEEAACQGLMAGINVICKLENKEPFILKRNESYIGVLIEDLINKEITDPYRLLTSRAEHRLELRNDNADQRLLKYGYELGLVSESHWKSFNQDLENFNKTIHELKNSTLKSTKNFDYTSRKTNITLYEILKRPDYSFKDIEKFLVCKNLLDDYWKDKIDISIKYEGYIKSQQKVISDYKNIESIKINLISDYKNVPNISLEAQEKLNKIKPLTLGQASRISGINLVDLINIKLYLENFKK